MSIQLLPRSKCSHRCGEDLRYSHQLKGSGCRKWPHCTLHHDWADDEHCTHRVLDLGSHHSISWIHVLREDEPLPRTGERFDDQGGQQQLLFIWRMQRPGSEGSPCFFGPIDPDLDPRLCQYWNKHRLQSGPAKLQR